MRLFMVIPGVHLVQLVVLHTDAALSVAMQHLHDSVSYTESLSSIIEVAQLAFDFVAAEETIAG